MEYLILIAAVVGGIYWFAMQAKKAPPAKQADKPSPPQRQRTVERHPDHFRVHVEINRRDYAQREPRPQRLSNHFKPFWLPKDKSVSVQGLSIDGGLLYVGKNLAAVNEYEIEPALINPDLKINKNRPDHCGVDMGYWPSYADIPPSCRAAYLHWLAEGRKAPGAYIGYVFLYLYGLERRILHDHAHGAADSAERVAIFNEVKRLLKIYGDNRSFSNYVHGFLFAIYLGSGDIDLTAKPPMVVPNANDLPAPMRLGLGQFSRAGNPIPADWALAWVLQDREIRLRTPARRCRREFAALFKQLYSQRHGDGLVVKPNKTQVSATYRPASGGMGGEVTIYKGPALPDITILKRPRTLLADIADQASNKLDAYSRFIGKDESGRDSLQGLALLPNELESQSPPPGLAALQQAVESQLNDADQALMPAHNLLSHFPVDKPDRLSKKEAVLLAQLLEKLNLGLEPDVRFCGIKPKPDEPVVVFRQTAKAPSAPSQAYEAATLVMRLAAMVATADEEVSAEEEAQLEQHIQTNLALDPAERSRLRAYMQWLLTSDQGMAGLNSKLQDLAAAQKSTICGYLLSMAAADGRIDPGEVKLLQKLYQRLGLDPERVITDIHSLTAGPVTVKAAIPGESGYRIPAPPTTPESPQTLSATPGRAALDETALRRKQEETRQVAAILGQIFTDEQAPAAQPVSASDSQAPTVAGLDAEHSALFLALGSQEEWERPALETLAERHGLLLDGALDTLNEAAFDSCDAPCIEEDDDHYHLDREIYQEMTA